MKLFYVFALNLAFTACSTVQFENKSEVNREGIRNTFTENRADIENCYSVHPAALNTAGKLIFDFEVDDQGRLMNASTSEEKSTMRNPELGKCICEKMKAWTFPKSASTETTRVLYPVYFSKEDRSVLRGSY